MNKSIPKRHFDNFFKDRYKKHTISPEKEMWEKINSRMNNKKIIFSLRKIQQLRIAVAVLAFALIGTITLIVTGTFKQKNTTIDLQEQSIPDLPAESISEKHLNSVSKVIISNQEQEEEDILEADNYIDDTNDTNSLEIILYQETDNYIEKNNSPGVTSK
ncbi:MAG: hypothetical protein K8R54_14225 [Bacteroidales bacterium]|nr:hypothetical protein [Bacteroidales bacterium]